MMGFLKRLFEYKVDIRIREGDRYLLIDAFVGKVKVGELKACYKDKKALLADIIIKIEM